MKHKIKWKVAEAPTGRYRSFYDRSWPSAEYNENPIARLECDDEYRPADVKTGNHAPITVYVADWSVRETNPLGSAFVWKKSKVKANTLKEAKEMVDKILIDYPHFLPKDA